MCPHYRQTLMLACADRSFYHILAKFYKFCVCRGQAAFYRAAVECQKEVFLGG
jgi:hypothetical protein